VENNVVQKGDEVYIKCEFVILEGLFYYILDKGK